MYEPSHWVEGSHCHVAIWVEALSSLASQSSLEAEASEFRELLLCARWIQLLQNSSP